MSCATHLGWTGLAAELDRWGEAGRQARLWWRDDDAVAPSARLDRLLALAGDAPVALAVIPAAAEANLAATLEDHPTVAVVQHGWSHADRGDGGRKSEYPAARPAAEVAAELEAGQARLTALFEERALPLLAPPWNRFADCLMPLLPAAGIAAVSQMAPRRGPKLPPALRAIDVHLDIVAWKAGGGFVGSEKALARLVDELRERRGGSRAADEPVGLLTHHLVMDPASEEFVARLGEAVAGHPAARWAGLGELMAAA